MCYYDTTQVRHFTTPVQWRSTEAAAVAWLAALVTSAALVCVIVGGCLLCNVFKPWESPKTKRERLGLVSGGRYGRPVI